MLQRALILELQALIQESQGLLPARRLVQAQRMAQQLVQGLVLRRPKVC